VPIRYMGTKRQLAPTVRKIVDRLRPRGRVVDLFAGMGSVAAALAPRWHVTTNDALSFTSAFSRCRFTRTDPTDVPAALGRLRAAYLQAVTPLRQEYAHRLREERAALESQRTLTDYMASAPHVGNCRECAAAATRARRAHGPSHYRLVSLYFAGGYFSLAQSVQFDAIRFAIDSAAEPHERDRALGAWIWAASLVINSPGHTAQYLKPNSKPIAARIGAFWRRDVWDEFKRAFIDLRPHGTAAWRQANDVVVGDAIDFLRSPSATKAGVVYADPPYTKDHYSRYYHVYETLYRYDFPDSKGEGRYPSNRFTTDFSKATGVQKAMETLAERVVGQDAALVLSYPSNGLLHQTGAELLPILRTAFRRVKVSSFAARHSTLGASSGSRVKSATENIYVCQL
jgi:adenine-specific DNA-methyltransferase